MYLAVALAFHHAHSFDHLFMCCTFHVFALMFPKPSKKTHMKVFSRLNLSGVWETKTFLMKVMTN